MLQDIQNIYEVSISDALFWYAPLSPLFDNRKNCSPDTDTWLLLYELRWREYQVSFGQSFENHNRRIWTFQNVHVYVEYDLANLVSKQIPFHNNDKHVPWYLLDTIQIFLCKLTIKPYLHLKGHIWLMQILHIFEFCSASWLGQIQKCVESA